MNSTPLFASLIGALFTLATPAALGCFILAGFALRGEGGINFDANGSFFRWITWGAIFLTLPGIVLWLQSQGLAGGLSIQNGSTSAYAQPVVLAMTSFSQLVLNKLVPVMAGALVLKAMLDSAEGHSPIPSIISALFLLGISGFLTLAQSWNDSSSSSTFNLLQNMLNWAMTSVSPVVGGLCVYGAIFQYLRGKAWVTTAATGIAFLTITSIWALVKHFAGVTI